MRAEVDPFALEALVVDFECDLGVDLLVDLALRVRPVDGRGLNGLYWFIVLVRLVSSLLEV